VSSAAVAYETADGQLVRAPFASGPPIALVPGRTGIGQYAISPNGQSISYLEGNAWHLATPSGDRLLTTLSAVPARGVNPDEDDTYLSFSPDGNYIAFFQTFHTGGSGETAPDQIRRASDGGLVYSTSGMTMAVWSSLPSRLFFRDSSGAMRRWDASAGVSSMLSLRWIGPRSSPDGRWIAYTLRTASGLGTVGLYSVQGNTVTNITPQGRSGVRFLTNDLVFYAGEKACNNCIRPDPTGQAYIYSIAGGSEVTARLSSVLDAWPRSAPSGVG
jgi:Tol biopolymer transport system component